MVLLTRLVAAATVVLAIAGPASAAAAPRKAAPVALAMSVAHRYWGATACAGRITVRTRQALPAGLSRDSDAWVTFASPLGANNLTAPASSFSGCTISLGLTRWPTRSSRVQDWDMLCMTLTHEYGHLLGHAHDLTPGSVMAPEFTDYSGEPQACRSTRPRSG